MVTTCARVTFSRKIGDAETAFTLGVAAFFVSNDFGIDEDQFGVRILFESDIDDGDAARDADWGAARPTPRAAYIDSNMSSASASSSLRQRL